MTIIIIDTTTLFIIILDINLEEKWNLKIM